MFYQIVMLLGLHKIWTIPNSVVLHNPHNSSTLFYFKLLQWLNKSALPKLVTVTTRSLTATRSVPRMYKAYTPVKALYSTCQLVNLEMLFLKMFTIMKKFILTLPKNKRKTKSYGSGQQSSLHMCKVGPHGNSRILLTSDP